MMERTDLSKATLDELKALANDVDVEIRERQIEKTVLNHLWDAAMAAKNKGLPKGHVMRSATEVINAAYGNAGGTDK